MYCRSALSLWVTKPVVAHVRNRMFSACLHVLVLGHWLPQVIEEAGGLGLPTDSGITPASVRTVDGHLLINGKNAAQEINRELNSHSGLPRDGGEQLSTGSCVLVTYAQSSPTTHGLKKRGEKKSGTPLKK